MEFSGSGLTAWYGTPDAPAPAERMPAYDPAVVVVGVKPVSASNAVSILYRENDGTERNVRATLWRTDYDSGRQYFRALIPADAPGTQIEYQPVVLCAGRRITTPSPFPSRFYVPAAIPQLSAEPSNDNAAPSSELLQVGNKPFQYGMEHITRVAVQLRKLPEVIGNTPDGLHIDFLVEGGLLRGQRLTGSFHPNGGDWMRIRTDGIGLTDILATIKTSDGALILMEASGKFDLGDDGFNRALTANYPKTGPVVLNPSFLSSDSRYFWLNRLACVAIGYVDMAALQVHYDVYGVRSLGTTTDGER
jgi:hypothetical protein